MPIDKLAQVLTEMRLLQSARHDNLVECYGMFLCDSQFPRTRPCVALEVMDVNVASVLLLPFPTTAFAADAAADGQPTPALAGDNDVATSTTTGASSHAPPTTSALSLAISLAPAVAHRDVKPGNVLLKRVRNIHGNNKAQHGQCDGSSATVKFVAKLTDVGLSQPSQNMAAAMTATHKHPVKFGTLSSAGGRLRASTTFVHRSHSCLSQKHGTDCSC